LMLNMISFLLLLHFSGLDLGDIIFL